MMQSAMQLNRNRKSWGTDLKHVRLPIYDQSGFMTGETLEVDLNFFLPSNPALKSNMARVISREVFRHDPIQEPLAEWEKELLGVTEESVDEEVGLEPTDNVEIEWRDLEIGPTRAFEISQTGVIRIKGKEKVLEPNWWDIDQLKFNVKIKINGMDYYIDGPKLADQMWSKK